MPIKKIPIRYKHCFYIGYQAQQEPESKTLGVQLH